LKSSVAIITENPKVATNKYKLQTGKTEKGESKKDNSLKRKGAEKTKDHMNKDLMGFLI
jgi:hypothetical protein